MVFSRFYLFRPERFFVACQLGLCSCKSNCTGLSATAICSLTHQFRSGRMFFVGIFRSQCHRMLNLYCTSGVSFKIAFSGGPRALFGYYRLCKISSNARYPLRAEQCIMLEPRQKNREKVPEKIYKSKTLNDHSNFRGAINNDKNAKEKTNCPSDSL